MKLSLVPKEVLECFREEIGLDPTISRGLALKEGLLVHTSSSMPVSLDEIDVMSDLEWFPSKRGVLFWSLVNMGLYNEALKTK